MKFKVGDKVKVRSGLKVGEIYNGLCYVKPMQKYEGKTLTISGIDDDNNRWYFVEEDGEEWCWTDDMLELNVDSSMTAEEVIKWLWDADEHVLRSAFGIGYTNLQTVFDAYEPEKIIKEIIAYEADKKAPKPVEVEEGYYCCVYKSSVGRPVDDYVLWGVDKQTAEDDARCKALKHTKETGEQMRVCVEFTCRIKED